MVNDQENGTLSNTSENGKVDWDKQIPFGSIIAEKMYLAKWTKETGWVGGIQKYQNVTISPAAIGLNYGQSVFEGLKAYCTSKGRLVLFRPELNAQRMMQSAESFLMPPVPIDLFLEACNKVVQENQQFVPPFGKGTMYIRPLLYGSGPQLVLEPTNEVTFIVYAAPVGNYYPGKVGMMPINILVEEVYQRAGEHGSGYIKNGGNYSSVMRFGKEAKKLGYNDSLFLDVKEQKYILEQQGANVFVVKDGVIKTPRATGAILNGVTRRSCIQIAQHLGIQVQECDVSVQEAMQADEIFSCGTAVVISPYKSLTYKGDKKIFVQEGDSSPVAQKLYDTLTGIQQEKIQDPFNWLHEVQTSQK